MPKGKVAAPKRHRSNSVDKFNNPLENSKRYESKQKKQRIEEATDHSKIAVFSRESKSSFAKKFWLKIDKSEEKRVTKSSLGDADTIKKFVGRQPLFQSDNFETQVEHLFKDKNHPHVIAVIEGKEEEANSIEIEEGVRYTKVLFKKGVDINNHIDDRQSMNIYVRDDMKDAYKIENETVMHDGKQISVVRVDYETLDKKIYRSLVVHIPNEFLGSDTKEKAMNSSFETYAKKVKKEQGITVTCYLGDTNYKGPMFENSVASMGGHLSSGKTLSPQCSSAQTDTNFMQSIPLGDDSTEYEVKQPSTLNYVKTDIGASTIGTDHPSIMTYTSHTSPISGRKPKAPVKKPMLQTEGLPTEPVTEPVEAL